MPTSRVVTASLPAESALHARIGLHDFIDCYRVSADMPVRRAAEIVTAFPKWVQALLRIRGWLTAPFGLTNDGPDAKDKIGIFPVELETANELVAGFNDRHLDFRVSVLKKNQQVFLSTWVHPHNWGGKLYLWLILPFHILVVRNALARVRGDAAAGNTAN